MKKTHRSVALPQGKKRYSEYNPSMTSRRKISDIETDLERRILRGLSVEWEIALETSGLDATLKISKPVFRLGEMCSKLGYWASDKCEICISRKFAFEYPWHAVREVLRHEMAHQLADQAFQAVHQTPHGPLFRKACRLLGADPKAGIREDFLLNGAKSSYTDKIRKLLSLAKSQNRHEAESALIKARSLMLKYGLKDLSDNRRRKFVSVFLTKPALRYSRDIYHMSRLLQEYYFIEAVWISTYLLDRDRIGRALEISGTRPHVETALYINDCLTHFINKEWSHYRTKRNLNHYRRTDFAIGIIEGFRNRLKRETVPQTAETKSLIKIADKALKSYVQARYPKIGWIKRYSSNSDVKVMRDGMKKGEKWIVTPGIPESSGNQTTPPLFLPDA